ncbi:reverse transcriptase, partial [Lasius niger]
RDFHRFLKTGPLRNLPLANAQYAYKEGRSTEKDLHHLVGRIETQLKAKGYAIGTFLDIEGAFDNTSNRAIKEATTRHGVPEPLVDWIEDMLTGRNLLVGYGDTAIKGKPDRGCPQGGVLFPLLWCLVVNDLLEDLQRKGFLTYGYADDIAIVSWCEAKGLTVNPSKTNILVFTRKYKPEPIEPLKLWGKEIPFTDSVRTIQLITIKAMSKSWGVSAKVALWLYKAILLPKLLYASVIWWPRTDKLETKNLLQSLQGSYLRAAVGAMKTTPTEALEIALCIPPLDLAAVNAARYTAYRLKCLGE